MAKELDFTLELDKETLDLLRKSFANDVKKTATMFMKVMDWGEAEIAKHAKQRHFFVGTGKGAAAKAEKGEFKFKNPDGTLRFKVRTSNLRDNIQEREVKIEDDEIILQVVAGVEYANDIEFGGPGRRAFPFMRPALEAKKPEIVQKLNKELKLIF